MADLSVTRVPSPLSTVQLSTEEIVSRHDLQQRDDRVREIAARIRDNAVLPAARKHVRTTLRKLAFPVWFGGVVATALVQVYYISRPKAVGMGRNHEQERFWFGSVQEAKQAFPAAQMLDDVPCVAAQIRPARA